jgi:hypothetical protein
MDQRRRRGRGRKEGAMEGKLGGRKQIKRKRKGAAMM